MILVHDVQNEINNFVRWPLHFEFPSYTSDVHAGLIVSYMV